jgi:hypothetical protein
MTVPQINLAENWVEYLVLLCAVLGFVFALLTYPSAFLCYVIFFLFGILTGRLWFRIRRQLRLGWSLIVIGFVVGFLIGAPHGNRLAMIVLFIIGMTITYYVHKHRLIESLEY